LQQLPPPLLTFLALFAVLFLVELVFFAVLVFFVFFAVLDMRRFVAIVVTMYKNNSPPNTSLRNLEK
jgi:hypothetical protein